MTDDLDRHHDAPRGSWLTYRYRLGGPDVAEQAGTMKAPSVMEAARRVVARRLSAIGSPTLVYLRLRAAGEDEVLVRVALGANPGRAPRYDVVSSDAWRFAAPRVDGPGGA